jgi:hypothetical protein
MRGSGSEGRRFFFEKKNQKDHVEPGAALEE